VTNAKIGRFPIVATSPLVDGGKFPAKAFEGEVILFQATAFREGHDKMAVELVLSAPSGKTTRHPMDLSNPGLDLWQTKVRLEEVGSYEYQVSAWDDLFETWAHNTSVKLEAGVDQELMMLEGSRLLEQFAASAPKAAAAKFSAFAKDLLAKKQSPNESFRSNS
jgi:starch synthase (maltosyl-transferring)